MHWTRRVGLLCLGLFSLGLGRACPGQDNIAVNNGGVVYLDDFSGSVFLSSDGGNYLLFHKVVGEGVGHEDGFSRLGVRTRLWEDFDRQIFGEIHALITDDARIGYNIGGGIRRQSGGGILGVHAWFDDYETSHENRYRQVTGGVEYLHPVFDIRSNVYIPIDETENFIGIVDRGTDLSFLGNNLVTAGVTAQERAYYGWDIEGGGPVPLAENWLRAYAGLYQLIFDGDNTTGFRARAEARFMEGVNLNLIVSEDDKYGTNVNLGVEVRFRGTMPTRFQSGLLADRRYDQVRRVWPVQTNVENVPTPIPVTNPGTDDAIRIVFVDNTNSGGTGTFEDPFEMLPAGDADADLFLVNTGSGSTLGNITLFDGQQILGAGKPHFVDTEQLGMVQLPSEFNQVSGNFPTLESTITSPIITLADNNVVSGFNLIGESGIAGSDVDNFLLECLHSDVITNGIDIDNATGKGDIRDVDFVVMGGGTGISVTNATPGTLLDLDITEVEVDGGESGIAVVADSGDVIYSIDNIEVVNTTVAGLTLAANSAALNGTVDGDVAGDIGGVILNDNFGNGVLIQLDNATGATALNAIEASGNGTDPMMDLDGVKIVAENMTDYTVDVTNSTINGAMDDGIDVDLDDSTVVVNVDPTSIVGSLDNAFEFSASNNSNLNANFVEVDMTSSLNDAINGMVLSGSNATLNFSQFDASGSTNDGLNVVVQDGSSLTATFDNSDDTTTFLDTTNGFSNSGGSAINIDVSDDSDASLTFTDINADNLAADGGVNLIANMNSQITSTWTNGSISNGLATGVTLDGDGAGTSIDTTFNNVAIDGNTVDGINASLTSGDAASALAVTLNSVTLTGNGEDGLDYLIDGTDAIGTIIFNEADLSGNLGDAFQFDVTSGAILTADTTVPMTPGTIINDFSGSGGNAFQGTVNGTDSIAIINISDADADSSGAEGALFESVFGGFLAFNYTNGTLDMSGLDGLSTNTETGATTTISLDNVTLNSNGQLVTVGQGDGLVATVDGTDSTLNLMLNDISTSLNFEKGVNLNATNSGFIDSRSNTGLFESTFNQEEGLYFDAQSGGMIAFNSVLGTTSDNGLGGNFSGVRGLVDGDGSAATVSFDNFTSDFNTQDGFEFDVTNGGMLVAEILSTPSDDPTATSQLSSASNNVNGAGIRLTASDVMGVGTTSAALIMEGDNEVSNNLEGLIVNATDTDMLAVQANGNFDNNGDFFNLLGGYGIQISAVNTTDAAIEIGDGTLNTASGNLAGGIEINLDNTNLDDITVLTLTEPVTGKLVESLLVDNYDINNNLGHGLNITATNGTVINDGEIRNVDANSNDDGDIAATEDGIRLFLDDSTINNFVIQNNGAQNNSGNGIHVDLANNSVSTGLSINNNTGAPQNLGVDFLIDGMVNVSPFAITNTSDPGLNISNITWQLADNGFSSPVFNTAGARSIPFAEVQGFTSDFTGLNSVNGAPVFQSNMSIPDNSDLLSMGFSDFNPNELFEFVIGLDPFDTGGFNIGPIPPVFGNDLIGSTLIVDFENGAQATGTLNAVTGNDDAAMFEVTSTNQIETGLLNNGEDGLRVSVNDSTMTDTSIVDNITDSNGSNGIEILIENNSMIDAFDISGRTANDNAEEGILVNVDNSTITNGLSIDGFQVDVTTGSNGIVFNASNGTVADSVSISNSVVQNSPSEGILVTGDNSTLDNVLLDGNIVTDNLDDGVNSTTGGVRIDLLNTAVAGTLSYNNGSIENSAGNGLTLNLDGSPVGRLEISGNDAGISSNAGSGVVVNATNGSNIGEIFIDSNDILDNGMNGIEFNVTDSALPTVGNESVISNNNIGTPAGSAGPGSTGAGDAFVMLNPDTNATDFQLDFVGNSFTDNNGNGINIALNDDSGAMTSTMSGNTISDNVGFGVRINSTGTSTVNLNLGDSTGNANSIQRNDNAGVAITLSGSGTSTLGVENTSITNTAVGTDNNFAGEGLVVRATDTATLDASNIGDAALENTLFSENAGAGVQLRSSLSSSITNLTMQNFSSTFNGGDGVNILRQGTNMGLAQIENVLIDNATISNNTGDGIDIVGTLGDRVDDYTIIGSTIDMNGGRGLSLEARIDAELEATVTDTLITNNGGDGISMTQVVNNMTDDPSVTLDLTGGEISGNTGFGIDVQATHELTVDGATIDSNSLGGINIGATRIDMMGSNSITNSLITGNGNFANGTGNGITNLLGVDSIVTGNTISSNAGNGLAITNGTHTIDDNDIEMNGLANNAAIDDGDGIQLISNEEGNLSVNEGLVGAIGNRIRNNRGRGINLLVQGNTTANVTFDNSRVEGNLEEGVYVVTTTSLTQNVDAPAIAPLANNGDLFADPILVFNMDQTDVISNGIDSTFDGTGLVLRIGTSGASESATAYEETGGFVSNGAGNLTGIGGVLASITNSVFEGNPGADVLIESFDSTGAPAATQETWDDANYEITAYEQDPLARLDLTFTGNTGDTADVVRIGASYANPEDVFKSRTTAQTDAAGPFGSGARERNAQRLASRTGFAAPTPTVPFIGVSGDSDDFMYSGVGGSTFRITTGSDTTGFTSGDDFTDMLQLGAGGTGELDFTFDVIIP